jgi:hypothetical protein
LENDSYKLYFDRTVLIDIHIKHNRPDIIILNKQQKQTFLLDIAVPNLHNITQTYNTKINKYLELSVAMRNLWCLEKNSILPLIISATGIVPQSLFKNLKILDLGNTLVVEIQKGILLYSCHIVGSSLILTQNIIKHNKVKMLISTALLLDSIIRNSVCTPAKLPCRRVVKGEIFYYFSYHFYRPPNLFVSIYSSSIFVLGGQFILIILISVSLCIDFLYCRVCNFEYDL